MDKYSMLLLFMFLFALVLPAAAQHDTIALTEVEIIDFKGDECGRPVDRIQPAAIKQTSAIDAGMLLSGIPNISGVRKGPNGFDPVIRGFKYSQLNVLLNGVTKIEGGCPNRMDPATAHVDINSITNITVYKGPYALKFGPSFGGIINISTWQPRFSNVYATHLKGNVGLQNNGYGYNSTLTLEGSGKMFSYAISGGSKKYGDYRDGAGRWVNASLQQHNSSARLGFKIGKKSMFDAQVDLSKGINIDFPALSMDEREDRTNIYTVNYKGTNVSNIIKLVKINGWMSVVNHTMDNKNRTFSDTVVAVSVIDARDAGIRGEVKFNMKQGTIESGLDYEHIYKNGQRIKSMIKQPGLPVKNESIWSNAVIDNMGIYSEYQLERKAINWIVSGRVDFNSAKSNPMERLGMNDLPFYFEDSTASKYLNISFSAGLTWKLNVNNRLIVSLGHGVRSPDMTERFIVLLPVGYDRYDYLGNPGLKPEANNEFDVGLRHYSKSKWYFDGNIFLSYVTHFIGSKKVPPSIARPQTKGVLGVKQFVNFPAVWLTGFEVSLESPIEKRWHLNINAAYTYGFNPAAPGYKIENGQVVDEYVIKNDPLPEIPPFEANISFQYKLFNGKLVPVINWRGVAAQKAISVSYGEQTSKSFQVINIKINYKFSANLTVWGGVNNVFNKSYFEHLNRNIIGSFTPLYEPGRNFFVNFIFNF